MATFLLWRIEHVASSHVDASSLGGLTPSKLQPIKDISAVPSVMGIGGTADRM